MTVTVGRPQTITAAAAPTVGLPAVATSDNESPPATIPTPRPSKQKRLLRLALPYAVAAGVAGALFGGTSAALVFEGVRARTAAATPAHAQPEQLVTTRAAYEALSFDELRTMRKQIEAATKAGVGFAIEPMPLTEARPDDIRRHWSLASDEVARSLAVHGRIYAGMLDKSRGYNRPVVESPSAKAIMSIAELKAYLAQFR